MSLPVLARRARLIALRDLVDAGGGGSLLIYGSAQPPTGAVVGEAPLLTILLDPVSFVMHATESNMTLSTEGNAAASGAPVWARFANGVGQPCMDLAAGLPGSGKPVIVSDGQPTPGNQMYVGGVATVNCTVTEVE